MSHYTTTYNPPQALWAVISPESPFSKLKARRGLPNLRVERGELERDWSVPLFFYSRAEARTYAHERNCHACTEKGRTINRSLSRRWIVIPVTVSYGSEHLIGRRK